MELDLGRQIGSIARRRWPEFVVGFIAGLIFLGYLGSLELWGKREQRAAAEALDTVVNQHWLVAQIQGRPRLEKPPLPRWITASLMSLTGRRDEWSVRLPSAIAALATVVLVYLLGRRIGGRRLALASSMMLCTTGLFVSELRQAGHDGLLGLFTTLALYTAWCRLHDPTSSRRSAILFHIALGLGFLCKGPIVLLLVGLTLLPYLLAIGCFWTGLKQLADGWGVLLFLGLALCWPVPVLLSDSNALGVWVMEIGQKTGMLPIAHRERAQLGLILPILALPWSVAGVAGLLLPLIPNRHVRVPWKPTAVWFPWCWAVGNLAMFSSWAVAKPSYYVPCLPGFALLAGMAWIRLCRAARPTSRSVSARLARGLLWSQWLIVLLLMVLVPFADAFYLHSVWPAWLVIIAIVLVCGVAFSIGSWKQGADALALVPIAASLAVCVLIGYGHIAPADNPARGHQQLARRLENLVAPDDATLCFFHEIDEGLWFYLQTPQLAPVPGSQPRYSESYDRLGSLVEAGGFFACGPDPSLRLLDAQRQLLLDWLRLRGRDKPCLLIRAALYDQMARDLNGLVTPLYREGPLKRHSLILLRAHAVPTGADVFPNCTGVSPAD
jgi:4-amino-4-deoxy-L-arabinose transferase-like glycosyltransferase